MMPMIATVCVLGVVIVGLLVMTQAVSLERLAQGIWQGFVVIVLAIIGACLVKSALLPILICGIVRLKGVMLRAFVIVLVAIAFALLLRVLFLRLARRNSSTKYDREES